LVVFEQWKRLLEARPDAARTMDNVNPKLMGRLPCAAIDSVMVETTTSGDIRCDIVEEALMRFAIIEESFQSQLCLGQK